MNTTKKRKNSFNWSTIDWKNNAFVSFWRNLPAKWYFLPVIGVLLLVLIYLLYPLFGLLDSVPNTAGIVRENYSHISLYYKALEDAYKAMLPMMNNISVVPVFVLALLVVAVVAIFLIVNKKITWQSAVGLVLIAAIIMRVLYGMTTDAIIERQHDVWHSRGLGHYGITIHIYETGSLPPLPTRIVDGVAQPDLAQAYQMYHPKFFYYVMAYFMRFNRLFFGSNSWTLYQSTRILLIWTSSMTLLVAYQTFKALKMRASAILIATMVTGFSPIFYRLSAMTNNDNFMVFFTFLAIYFAVIFYQKPTIYRSIGLGLAIGLAMASKLSAALIALPIGVMLVILFVKTLMTSKDNKQFAPLFHLVFLLVIFAVIVFPIGLYWPLYNLKHYNQPLTYVFEVTNPALIIKDKSFWDRFILIPFDQLTKSPFVDLSWNNRIGDFNLYTTMLKSSAFGEFSSKFSLLAIMLYFFTVVLFFATIFAVLFIVVTLNKKRIINNKSALLVGGVITALFFLSYAYFNYQYPATCTMDFRYIVPAVFGSALIIGQLLTYGEDNLPQKFVSSLQTGALTLVGMYSLFSIAYYIALSTI